MNTTPLACPFCKLPLFIHQPSQGFYCDEKHRLDKNAQGYYSCLLGTKHKLQTLSRQQMRAKQFLLASGLYAPLTVALVEVMQTLLSSSTESTTKQWLDYQCGDGFFIRQLHEQLENEQLHTWGVSDAENALFAANKLQTPASLLLSSMKRLPFNDASVDVITVLDSALKGQECQRVLKQDGRLVLVLPNTKHLWQLRKIIQPDLVEKPLALNLPKTLIIDSQTDVTLTQVVSAQQGEALIAQSNFGWRTNKTTERTVANITEMEVDFDWRILVLKRAQ